MIARHRVTKTELEIFPRARCKKARAGFERDVKYAYQRCPSGDKKGQPYVRVWPDVSDPAVFNIFLVPAFERHFVE